MTIETGAEPRSFFCESRCGCVSQIYLRVIGELEWGGMATAAVPKAIRTKGVFIHHTKAWCSYRLSNLGIYAHDPIGVPLPMTKEKIVANMQKALCQ